MSQEHNDTVSDEENKYDPMQIEEGACYLVRSVDGGSVLCAKASQDSNFPKMNVACSIDLSAKLCGSDVARLENYTLNLAIAVPYSDDCCNGDNLIKSLIYYVNFIERV